MCLFTRITKQLSGVEEKPITSSKNICGSVNISFKDDVNVILLLDVSFMTIGRICKPLLGIDSQPGGIYFLESVPGLLKHLKIRALDVGVRMASGFTRHFQDHSEHIFFHRPCKIIYINKKISCCPVSVRMVLYYCLSVQVSLTAIFLERFLLFFAKFHATFSFYSRISIHELFTISAILYSIFLEF